MVHIKALTKLLSVYIVQFLCFLVIFASLESLQVMLKTLLFTYICLAQVQHKFLTSTFRKIVIFHELKTAAQNSRRYIWLAISIPRNKFTCMLACTTSNWFVPGTKDNAVGICWRRGSEQRCCKDEELVTTCAIMHSLHSAKNVSLRNVKYKF